MTKVQSNLQLDLNLEKGRIKEEVSPPTLLRVGVIGRCYVQATGLRQEVKDTNNRIDMEVGMLYLSIPVSQVLRGVQ